MVMQVNQELCAGCGVCMEACSVGAIHLENNRAVIDDELCTQCKACVDVCPNKAITARITPIIASPASESRIISIPIQSNLPVTIAPARGPVPLVGAVLAFLGSEVAPRLVDVLTNVLERRLARPTTIATTSLATPSRSLAQPNKGTRRQTRYRGGRSINGNQKERR